LSVKIAVLGAKSIGSTLARQWAQAGHEIMFGVRTVDNLATQALAKELGAAVGVVGEAIPFGDVVVFAIPGSAMEETIRIHGPALAGKIAVDAANRMGGGPMNSVAAFTTHAPGAQIYRAFNSLGWETFADPLYGDIRADLFYCGPAGAGQAAVEQLIADVGLRPVRVGDANQVELVDIVGALWLALVFGQGMSRHLAFKVLTR
jgi:predicted dinucleotide-binding enzyme